MHYPPNAIGCTSECLHDESEREKEGENEREKEKEKEKEKETGMIPEVSLSVKYQWATIFMTRARERKREIDR